MYTEVSDNNVQYKRSYVPHLMYCLEPTPDLFQQFNKNQFDTIHLYVDVKNSSTSLFIPDVVQKLCERSRSLKSGLDSTIFQNILLTVCNWTAFAKSNKKKIKIFFCNDEGKSIYHLNINPEYKANRKITNTILAECADELHKIKVGNWTQSEKICNKINDVYFINMRRVESDFIPYYLITRHFKDATNIIHILASNDKDHYQFLNLPNTVMFSKKGKDWQILNKSSYLFQYIKFKDLKPETQSAWIETISKIDHKYIDILMALCGDSSDNVKGLYKIGEKYAAKMISNKEVLEALIGDYEEMLERVLNGGLIFQPENLDVSTLDKYWKLAVEDNEIVTNSFKQISYEMLSRWMEKNDSLRKKEIVDNIKNIVFKENNDMNKLVKDLSEILNVIEDNSLDTDKLNVLLD